MYTICTNIYYYVKINFHLLFRYFLILEKRKGEREMEKRESNMDVSEKHLDVASYMRLDLGSNTQPGYAPWLIPIIQVLFPILPPHRNFKISLYIKLLCSPTSSLCKHISIQSLFACFIIFIHLSTCLANLFLSASGEQ